MKTMETPTMFGWFAHLRFLACLVPVWTYVALKEIVLGFLKR
jgi:hypothetical protein